MSGSKIITVLAGDGIGPEIMREGVKVVNKVGQLFKHDFKFQYGLIGGAAYEKHQNHFPLETKDLCNNSHAILFGAVGGPLSATSNRKHPEYKKFFNAEKNSLLGLRQEFNFAVNVRPCKVFPSLQGLSSVRSLDNEVDFVIIRELVGDVYFGEHKTLDGGKRAIDIMEYTEDQVLKPLHFAFKAARQWKLNENSEQKPAKVTLVDKANVLDTSRLWRRVAQELQEKEYSDVELEFMFVDNAAMQLVQCPKQFKIVVTSNLFGDILSDVASVLPGSLGLMPSASLNIPDSNSGEVKLGMYEPSGGSAPDIAGKNVANPIGQILSAAMMLKYSFKMHKESALVHAAVENVIAQGKRTVDLIPKDASQQQQLPISTEQMGDAVVHSLEQLYH